MWLVQQMGMLQELRGLPVDQQQSVFQGVIILHIWLKLFFATLTKVVPTGFFVKLDCFRKFRQHREKNLPCNSWEFFVRSQ